MIDKDKIKKSVLSRMSWYSSWFGYVLVASSLEYIKSSNQSILSSILLLIVAFIWCLSIYWGFKALTEIKNNPTVLKGKWPAIFGIVASAGGLLLLILAVVTNNLSYIPDVIEK